MQNEMKYKLTSPYFSRAIPKLLIHLTKEWGLMNGERPIGLKMAWDAAALLDKAIHVSRCYIRYAWRIHHLRKYYELPVLNKR